MVWGGGIGYSFEKLFWQVGTHVTGKDDWMRMAHASQIVPGGESLVVDAAGIFSTTGLVYYVIDFLSDFDQRS
jgi:hypothetical protein